MAVALALRGTVDVEIVCSAEAAMKSIETVSPFAAVLSDYHLPGRDGLQLLAWLRRHRPSVRRFLVSGARVPGIDQALASGLVERFLSKPFSAEQVVGCLNDAP